MTSCHLNYLNITLMLISSIVAIFFPIELFLVSYAVLGPLHYLTEISWLHDRKYFMKKKRKSVLLYMAGILSFLFILYPSFYQKELNLLVFLLAGILMSSSEISKKALMFVFACALTYFLMKFEKSILFFSFLLTTFVHVYFFTGFFILLGAIRSKKFSDYLSLSLYVTIPVLFFLPISSFDCYEPVGQASQIMFSMAWYQHLPLLKFFEIRTTSIAITNAIQFMAFSYTYHYLNWFSKTKVIQWHQIGKGRLCVILFLYFFLLTIYLYDYQKGLVIAYFLSIVHVYLEFPLNIQTIRNILGLSCNVP